MFVKDAASRRADGVASCRRHRRAGAVRRFTGQCSGSGHQLPDRPQCDSAGLRFPRFCLRRHRIHVRRLGSGEQMILADSDSKIHGLFAASVKLEK